MLDDLAWSASYFCTLHLCFTCSENSSLILEKVCFMVFIAGLHRNHCKTLKVTGITGNNEDLLTIILKVKS